MTDNFFFSGLNGWFGNNFEPYSLFGYLGDRDNIKKYQDDKSVTRRIIEAMAPSVNISTILTAVSGINISLGQKQESQVAKKIIEIVNEHDNRRRVSEFLAKAQKHSQRQSLVCDSVERQFNKESAIATKDQTQAHGRLTVVEAQLLNRGSVGQYSSKVASSLKPSQEEWFFSDFPPHALTEKNDRFGGKILLIKEDAGFSNAYSKYLPFCRDIGWYPYCRITGFFDSNLMATEIFPRISAAFIEYRRPKMMQEVEGRILQFFESEASRRNYLKERSDLVLAAYLLPIIARGSNIEDYKVPDEYKPAVQNLASAMGAEMPLKLADWYKNALL